MGTRTRSGRTRGRPRLPIDRDAVADAVAELVQAGGYASVSFIDIAEKLEISRATLYRTFPTKQELVGILVDRHTSEITAQLEAALGEIADPARRLEALVRAHAEAAVRMREGLRVSFGEGDLPKGAVQHWRACNQRFEEFWLAVVTANMEAGYIERGDPVVTTRLLVGMFNWISRWYRPEDKIPPARIADEAIRLLRLGYLPQSEAARGSSDR